jgi:hypothetical protein
MSFWGTKGVCEALYVLALVIQTFFFWLVFFSMDFAIHNLSNCEAHHGKANGDSRQLTNVTNTPMHHVVVTKRVEIEEELVLFVELPKNQQLWHYHN